MYEDLGKVFNYVAIGGIELFKEAYCSPSSYKAIAPWILTPFKRKIGKRYLKKLGARSH